VFSFIFDTDLNKTKNTYNISENGGWSRDEIEAAITESWYSEMVIKFTVIIVQK